MGRRTMTAWFGLIAVGTLVAGAAPASAAPLQDFTLAKNGGSRVVVAQGAIENGVGTFASPGPNRYTLNFSDGTVDLGTTPTTNVQTVDPRTCRATVYETGTFSFSKFSGEIIFGGSGPYNLVGSRQGTKTAVGCAFTSPDLTQFSLTARSTEIHAVA
ncbi:MAG: hypothetical protein QOE93_861 [Actinomycetota bacterium]|nr:hypothetical protein [Actinomycetota bacterium]